MAQPINKQGDSHVERASVRSNNGANTKEEAGDVLQAQQMVAEWQEGTKAEKRLRRKLDFRILPCTWILYLLGFLDRANIGNAKTGGLEDDFNLSSEQYSIIVLVFFISYLIFEIPSNMVLVRVRPSRYLPGLGLLWGTFATLMAATQNWHQLAGLRFLLGVAESGFAPGCAFFLSAWYRRFELLSRYSLLYTSVPLAGAVSGLIAGVITQHMEGAGGIAGWRWLFVGHRSLKDSSLSLLRLSFSSSCQITRPTASGFLPKRNLH
ncbi:major facilitator superfamily domain-containing protein [Xylariaceae sp. FL0662B]|nr:major facilitator superfamily domain-containing protein [Xylariaceae sp. FL0662B]